MSRDIIVITGGEGFVGRHLISELRREKSQWQLVVWDKVIKTLPVDVEGRVVDISNQSSYRQHLQELQPAWVIHLAAISSVTAGLKNPKLTTRVNVQATRSLLETIEAVSPKTKVLAISTADIYGQGSASPLSELSLAEAKPKNPYATSKWQMEQMIEQKFLDRVIRVRPFPHIGPGQPLGFVTADFASQIAAIEAGGEPAVLRVGNLDAVRDFTDVRDVVRAYRMVVEAGKIGQVYNVASGVALRIQDVLDQLLRKAKVSIKVETDSTRLRPADTSSLVGDATKLREATGWQPHIPLAQTFDDILAYWRDNVSGTKRKS